MGMQTLMPDGEMLRESFDSMKKLFERKDELEKRGGKVQQITIGSRVVFKRPPSNPKYPHSHQGDGEIARRKRQIERGMLKATAR